MPDQTGPVPTVEIDRAEAVIDACRAARSLPDLKSTLMTVLHEHYHCPNTTFLVGHTFRTAFTDPDTVTTGRVTTVIDEYHDRWHHSDIFATPQAFAALRRHSAISYTQLRQPPAQAVDYVDRFLFRKDFHSATALHFTLANDAHAVVGLFDSAGHDMSPHKLAGLTRVSNGISELARTLPGPPVRPWRDSLTARQQELTELICDGHTTEEIAIILSITTDTVKKYVTRIFAATGVRNRTELVKLVFQEKISFTTQ
ncbi:helix-turn-helix transcriptional regulator [Gordonia sp. TBRC 11910]|uniref:Helix-turn-helix transcriptional regulator n=1 Tax=Gordonia asplenii TaxID=2725283 RepID=A0A848L0A9_9ACTN|nr:helix-turn-helix transcriptional regulator [Gordonia asplenii]NMO04354.1 helix-turn-helix transcriptional regulator [Gordonia asplenii]